MGIFVYTARRSLISNHIDGVSYTLDMPLQNITRSKRVVRNVAGSLGGAEETIRIRDEVFYDIASSALAEDPSDETEQFVFLGAAREFLDSVDGGETFQFSADGIVYETYRMESASYSEDRVELSLPYVRVRFRIKRI